MERVRHSPSVQVWLRRSRSPALAILAAILPPSAAAQRPEPQQPFYAGPYAGVVFAPASVSIGNDARRWLPSFGAHFGIALRPFAGFAEREGWRTALRHLRLTPHGALTISHVKGIDPEKDSLAFSSFSVLGLRATWDGARRVRPFVLARSGKLSAELPTRVEGAADVDNVWGSGLTTGLGIEFPVFDNGRGFELAILRSTGRLTNREAIDRVSNEQLPEEKISLSYRSLWIQFGWSGPFTGVSLPWR